MPYVSQAQAGYFHTHKAQLERQGVNVDEWDKATKGQHLPKRAAPMKSEGTKEARYAEGGAVLPRAGDWKKTVPNRGFLDTPNRFTGRKEVAGAKTDENWGKSDGDDDDMSKQKAAPRAVDKSEKAVKPR